MKVLKFGGTSLASSKAIEQAASIIEKNLETDPKVAVVISAVENITDDLLLAIEKSKTSRQEAEPLLKKIKDKHLEIFLPILSKARQENAVSRIDQVFSSVDEMLNKINESTPPSPRLSDQIIGFGEKLSAFLVHEFLQEKFAKTALIDSEKLIKAEESSGDTTVDRESTLTNLANHFENLNVAISVIPGFIASTKNNESINLGRGGSDYTASLVGLALKASEIQIWTTVDGMMTADPEKVPKAISIPSLSYLEAMELSHFGARVVYAPTLQPAKIGDIPVVVKNSLKVNEPGSVISSKKPSTDSAITGISAISDLSLLRVEGAGLVGVSGTARRVFRSLSENNINVILISQASSEHSICFALKDSSSKKAITSLNEEFSNEIKAGKINSITSASGCSIIAVVGENMRQSPGLSGKVFQALGQNGINVQAIAQGSSELNLSIVVNSKDEVKGLKALHDAFFASTLKTINLFCVGVGQVGATLLQQLAEHSSKLKKDSGLDIRLIGLANSKRSIFKSEGINSSTWQQELESEGSASSIEDFVSTMIETNLPNSIFIDNTAHDVVANFYEQILGESISVVTPNKKANSSSYARFLELQQVASKANVNFFYETNVGAGLPVIETLKDLMRSGDEVLSIEAVLSGTLSYIFNTFDGSDSFSKVVEGAKESGFTEPDPRDDLSGMDVARKILILGREMGLPLEESDVSVESLVPSAASNASSVEEFMNLLPQGDQEYEEIRSKAAAEKKKLVYMAKISEGKAVVKLSAVTFDHPFSSLQGSDNIISFTTKRYNACPLVVKGPGAGTQVTAAGVFADIVKAASYLV